MAEIIITDKKDIPRYKLKPLGSGSTLCFEMLYWKDAYIDKDGEEKEGAWRSSGKYPDNFAYGLRTIAEQICRDEPWELFSRATPKELLRASELFNEVLNKFSVQAMPTE